MADDTYPVKWSNLREMFKRVAGYLSDVDDRIDAIDTTPAPSVYISHTYVTDETTLVSTNQPVGTRFFLNNSGYATKIDLTDCTECRLLVMKLTTAANTGATMEMRYRAAGYSATVGNYNQIGTSAVSVATDTTGTLLDSGWIPLAANAQQDVAIIVQETGGNGVLDPVFGSVVLQFRS